MKYTLLLFFLFATQSFADEKCDSFVGVKLNGFVGDTVQEIAKTQDCNENLKSLKFNYIEGQNKSDFCACTKADPKTLAGNSQRSIRAERRYQEIKKKTQNEAEVKFAKTLRNKIFGTLSRSFKFDNLAKRGYIGNELAKDEKLNLCSIDKILENIGNFDRFVEINKSCNGKGKIFEERKKLLFPEGEETFIQNLKDTANTVAKGVRAEGSCLTYQNYLELNSTVPENSEAIKLMMKSTSWEDFKASVAEELRYYDNFKSLQNQMRQSVSERSSEVANNLWGFSGKQVRGKDVYKMIKSNPNFELALRDKAVFEQMKNSMNLFESEYSGSSGGGIDYKKTNQYRDYNDLLKNNSDTALRVHLKSCDNSEQSLISSGGRGGTPTPTTLGLKQSIAKFLCDEALPAERVDGINNSLDTVIGFEDKNNKALRDSLRSDLICESSTSPNQSFLSDIDSMLDVSNDLDVQNEDTFLKDYKDYSVSFCGMVDPECPNPQKSISNTNCSSLASMTNNALSRTLEIFLKSTDLSEVIPGNTLSFLMVIANTSQISDLSASKSIIKFLNKNYPGKFSSNELETLKEKILFLRSHSDRINLNNLASQIINEDIEPPENSLLEETLATRDWKKFFISKEGQEYLSKLPDKSMSARVSRILSLDTSLSLSEDLSNSLFADTFTNGHRVGNEEKKAPTYISEGPSVDVSHYGYSPPVDTSKAPRNPLDNPRDDKVIVGVQVPIENTGTITSNEGQAGSQGKIKTLDDLVVRIKGPAKRTPPIEKKPDEKKPEDRPVIVDEIKSDDKKSEDKKRIVGDSTVPSGTSFQTISFSNSATHQSDFDSSSGEGSRSFINFNDSDPDKLKKQRMLEEIARIKEQLKDGDVGNNFSDDAISPERLAEHEKLKERIRSLENEFEKTERSMRNNSSGNKVVRRNNTLNGSNYGIQSDTDPDYWNNIRNKRDDFNPRDPFKRQDTNREITPEHMNEIDPSGSSIASKSGGRSKGKDGGSKKGGVGLTGGSDGDDGFLAGLGLKPIKRRGPASNDIEPDPEELCGFEEQELNCIFEHSEIFARYKKDQIRSLVEGLLLHGYTFKTIEIFRNRDPSIPYEYVIHYFEPAKNLSVEEKKTQFELIKKMMTNYKRNFSFLKAVADKVVKTKSVKISKKEAFSILKHTLKRVDVDKLLIRRLKTIERLPANAKIK